MHAKGLTIAVMATRNLPARIAPFTATPRQSANSCVKSCDGQAHVCYSTLHEPPCATFSSPFAPAFNPRVGSLLFTSCRRNAFFYFDYSAFYDNFEEYRIIPITANQKSPEG